MVGAARRKPTAVRVESTSSAAALAGGSRASDGQIDGSLDSDRGFFGKLAVPGHTQDAELLPDPDEREALFRPQRAFDAAAEAFEDVLPANLAEGIAGG
jgi:hypothetical protein